jgi:hypothetical protein
LVFGESFLYTLHLFKDDFAAENRISESSAAAPSTEISVPSIVFELKFLSLLCISVEHNANRNFSDDSSNQIKFGDMGCTNVLSVFFGGYKFS